jgi:hypothetical protein
MDFRWFSRRRGKQRRWHIMVDNHTCAFSLFPATCVLFVCGSCIDCARTWGRGPTTGHGTDADVLTPHPVKFFQTPVSDVAFGCDGEAGCVAGPDGAVFTWGRGARGALARGVLDREHHALPGPALASANTPLVGVRRIALGYQAGAVITLSGELWTWGSNEYGKGGSGDNDPRASHAYPRPVVLPAAMDAAANGVPNGGIADAVGDAPAAPAAAAAASVDAPPPEVVDVALGSHYAGCVLSDGRLCMWGAGAAGNLGLGGRPVMVAAPRVVGGALAGERVVQVSCTRGQTKPVLQYRSLIIILHHMNNRDSFFFVSDYHTTSYEQSWLIFFLSQSNVSFVF